jgi:hypothetical protein
MLSAQHKMPFACVAALALVGCRSPGEGPFLQVQFCLTGTAGADELKRVLRQVARDEGLKFTDRSAETEAELRGSRDLPPTIQRSFPIINVSMRGGDDTGLGAVNAGLPANQVVIGFSPHTAKEQAFAKRTVQRLQQTWKLVRVPEGKGAFPLKNCPVSR